MTLLNGNLGWMIMRDRGRIRTAVANRYSDHLRRLYADFMRGEWIPLDSKASVFSVSMTSWRPRLPDLPLVLLSLLQQSVRPPLINVWLATSDFDLLDSSVKERFAPYGVRFAISDDLGPHKKWLPMIEQGTREPFVICDDDILYPRDWLKNLTHEDRDDSYVGVRCHRIQYDVAGIPLPYSEWSKDIRWEPTPSSDLFITGCGGAIIRPARLAEEFLNRARILECCPKADDIWLKAAHAAAGIPCYKTRYSFPCLEIPGTFETGLLQTNVDDGGNDNQVKAVGKLLKNPQLKSYR